MRFLFTRRWIVFALVVAGLAYLAYLLGQWQFHRLEDRRAENDVVARNLEAPPVPVSQVLRVGRGVAEDDEWRKVVAHGTWDDARTIVLKYQTRDGAPGVDALTPLITADGTAVLVDRGWTPTPNVGNERPALPPAQDGDVTVIGWVRADATGRAARIDDLTTRAPSAREAARALDLPFYEGFVDLESESPRPTEPLAAIELPDDTSEGPHFFYGLQWWFFAALALFGFGYLAVDEARQARRARESEGAQHPAVDGEHDAGDEG